MTTFIITSDQIPTYKKYIEGVIYKDKGKYLGESKGAHKFERHTQPFYQRLTFGPRYYFEKI